MGSCLLIGHREVPGNILPALQEAVEHHITCLGVTEFIVGHYGGFDHMAAKAIVEAKQRHPEVTLALLLPYHPAERPIETPAGFDHTYYPPGMETIPRRFAIVRANRYMAERAEYLIVYAWHQASNAWNLIEFARSRGIPVTNLATGKIKHT